MQPFPVCALCSAPDALVASPPLPRAAPARMAGQGPVQRLPRGYDRCAAGPLPSRNLRGNPEPDVAPRGTAGDRGGTRPVLGAVRAGGADAGDADRADGAEAWAQGRTGMLLDKTPMLSTRRAPRRRSAFFGQDPYNLGRCRHRRAGGRGARRGSVPSGLPGAPGPRGARPGGNRGFSDKTHTTSDGADIDAPAAAAPGGLGGAGIPEARGTRGARPGDNRRCSDKTHTTSDGADIDAPAGVGSVASGCPERRGPRGTRPGDDRGFSDKTHTTSDGADIEAPAGVAPGGGRWRQGCPGRRDHAARAQATIGVSRTRFHETWDGADIDTPAAAAPGGVGDVRVARSAEDDAAPAQATIGTSRTRFHETWDGAGIDTPAGMAPGGVGGVRVARSTGDRAASVQATIGVFSDKTHTTSDGADIDAPAGVAPGGSAASGLPGARAIRGARPGDNRVFSDKTHTTSAGADIDTPAGVRRRSRWRRDGRGAGDTRCPPRRQSAFLGQDSMKRGTVPTSTRRRGRRRQGCPDHRGPRGARPGDNRRFSDKIP
jgi:hypothetical protein